MRLAGRMDAATLNLVRCSPAGGAGAKRLRGPCRHTELRRHDIDCTICAIPPPWTGSDVETLARWAPMTGPGDPHQVARRGDPALFDN